MLHFFVDVELKHRHNAKRRSERQEKQMTMHQKLAALTDEQLTALRRHALGLDIPNTKKNKIWHLIQMEQDSRAFKKACPK